jgi:secondary thiamine-phosphate synthase enzyme
MGKRLQAPHRERPPNRTTVLTAQPLYSICMTFQHQLSISTSGNGDMHDLTEDVAAAVTNSRIKMGIVNIFNVGTTAAVGTIEFEPGLEKDLPAILNKLIPASRSYGHEQAWHDGTGHSHLQATLQGPSLTVPVADGKLVLGTWQLIFHLECDVRGRERKVFVTLLGRITERATAESVTAHFCASQRPEAERECGISYLVPKELCLRDQKMSPSRRYSCASILVQLNYNLHRSELASGRPNLAIPSLNLT